MRRMLRILFWLGLGLSTILFVGTVVLWVRSLGHREVWYFNLFEPRPEWNAPNLTGQGIWRQRYIEAEHGRLWLMLGTSAGRTQPETARLYRRDPISAKEAEEAFDARFQAGERPWIDGTEKAWRFAGSGFWHGRRAVDSRFGWPQYEGFFIAVPFWLLAAVFGLWPLLFAARRLLRRRRYGTGLCPSCGYDLRATPDPARPLLPRCPECGREVATAAAK